MKLEMHVFLGSLKIPVDSTSQRDQWNQIIEVSIGLINYFKQESLAFPSLARGRLK